MKKATFLLVVVFVVAAMAACLSACEKAPETELPSKPQEGETASVRISFYVDGSLYGMSICSEDTLTMVRDPEKDGYSFVGWFYDEELTIPFVAEEFLAKEDKTDVSLYAAWNELPQGGDDFPETPDDGGGQEGDGSDQDGSDGDGQEDQDDPGQGAKVHTVTFVLDGEIVSAQKVEDGKSALLPLASYKAEGNELYALKTEGDYTAVTEDVTVTLSYEPADEEQKGLFALGFLTLEFKVGNSKLYLSDVSAAYPFDWIVIPSTWGGVFAIDGVLDGAFARVPQLTCVRLGDYCTDIEWEAFADLPLFKTLEFTDGNPSFSCAGLFVTDKTGEEALAYVGYNGGELTFPHGIKRIGERAFAGSGFTGVSLPSGVIEIGEGAFENCAALTHAELPSDLAEIGKSAFENCVALENIVIPEGVVLIGERAFAGCSSAKTVYYNAVNAQALVSDNCVFDGAGSLGGLTLVTGENVRVLPPRLFDATGAGEVYLTGVDFSLSGGLTTVGAQAFAGTAIKTLVIPQSVVTLSAKAFEDCAQLERVEYRAQSAQSQGISGTAFSGAGAEGSVFVVGKEVERVPDYLLYSIDGSVKFSSLSFEEGVLESIGILAFAKNAFGGEVAIPATVTEIGYGAFSEIGVTAFIVSEGSESFISEGDVLYSADKSVLVAYPTGKRQASFATGEEIAEIAAYAFAGAVYLEKVQISCARVGEFAFLNCSQLAEAGLSEGVEEILTGAFANCTTLSSLVCPSSLRKIGENAFMYCRALSVVGLNEGLTEIGSRAFAYCGSLGEVAIPSTVTTLGDDVFVK